MAFRSIPPLLLAFVFFGCSATLGCDPATPRVSDVAVHVGGVGFDPLTETPVVVLEESEGKRTLPIWIGINEARSIATQMESIEPPRPNTHDLAKRLLNGLDARVTRVVVTELRSGTYFAILVLQSEGKRIEIDARPSDAIAIALRTQAPVFVREALFEASRDAPEESEAEEKLEL